MPMIAALYALAASAAQPAQPPKPSPEEEEDEEVDERLLAIGVHLGPRIGFDGLNVALLPRAEVGLLVPGTRERLLVFTTLGWTAPGAQGVGTDSRVGGPYDWDLTLNQIQLGLGLAVDLAANDWKVHPELALAPQLWFLNTRADGSAASEPFGEYHERWTTVGGMAALGVGFDLGPGRLMVRGEGTLVPVDATITGKLTSVAVTPTLGYRFLL